MTRSPRGWFLQFQPAESPWPVKSNPFTGGLSDQGMATEYEWGDIMRIGRLIHIPDNATDISLFFLPVQTTGADAFELALCLISHGLEGVLFHLKPDKQLIDQEYHCHVGYEFVLYLQSEHFSSS